MYVPPVVTIQRVSSMIHVAYSHIVEMYFHRIHRVVHSRERTVRRLTGFQSIATITTSVQRGNDMCGEREKMKKGRGDKEKEKKGETSASEEKEYLK